MDDPLPALDSSPELFPHSLDARRDTVSFVRLERECYAAASFLDARVLVPGTATRPVPWQVVAELVDAAALAECCSYLFHIGHVGSTLLSRLIGAHPRAFALREPLVLRTLAHYRDDSDALHAAWQGGDFQVRLSGCVKLLSRTFEPQQRAVVKATSFVSELAGELLSRPSAPAAIMMYVAPEVYFATILGGPNSRQEARLLTPARLRRLRRRVGQDAWNMATFHEGEALALGWACEMAALAAAAAPAGNRILRVDFDRFLIDPQGVLLAALRHVGIDAAAEEVQAILAGPDLHRYSKAPEYAYDAELRAKVLDDARAGYGAEIDRGLRWLESAAARFPAVRDAVRFAALGS